ncbi:ComF family protein [Candidatus Saccharibacteria bacterium]|nr:MAG: ComF family protein [Candidatus Saccharibacteria bacterium]
MHVALHYDGLAKELLHHAKYERARSGLAEMAELLAPLLAHLPKDAVLVPVPTATRRVRQRGYDQAEVLARILAGSQNVLCESFLARTSQAHQVGSGKAERLRHLEGAFRIIHANRLQGKHIILVDDVLTSGATLETAGRLLKKAGAKQVDAIVFAQAGMG